jgi:hypothetical protein
MHISVSIYIIAFALKILHTYGKEKKESRQGASAETKTIFKFMILSVSFFSSCCFHATLLLKTKIHHEKFYLNM